MTLGGLKILRSTHFNSGFLWIIDSKRIRVLEGNTVIITVHVWKLSLQHPSNLSPPCLDCCCCNYYRPLDYVPLIVDGPSHHTAPVHSPKKIKLTLAANWTEITSRHSLSPLSLSLCAYIYCSLALHIIYWILEPKSVLARDSDPFLGVWETSLSEILWSKNKKKNQINPPK